MWEILESEERVRFQSRQCYNKRVKTKECPLGDRADHWWSCAFWLNNLGIYSKFFLLHFSITVRFCALLLLVSFFFLSVEVLHRPALEFIPESPAKLANSPLLKQLFVFLLLLPSWCLIGPHEASCVFGMCLLHLLSTWCLNLWEHFLFQITCVRIISHLITLYLIFKNNLWTPKY